MVIREPFKVDDDDEIFAKSLERQLDAQLRETAFANCLPIHSAILLAQLELRLNYIW